MLLAPAPLVIGLDIDETIAISEVPIGNFWPYLDRRGITNHPDIYYRTHEWEPAVPGLDANELYVEYSLSGEAPLPGHMPGALEVLLELDDEFNLPLITIRDPRTIPLLEPHLRQVLLPNVRLGDIHPCAGKTKVPAIIATGAHLFIDDSRSVLKTVAEETNAKPIQFPSFGPHGCEPVNHVNVIRLPACDRVGKDDPDDVRYSAWQQILDIAMKFAHQHQRHRVA